MIPENLFHKYNLSVDPDGLSKEEQYAAWKDHAFVVQYLEKYPHIAREFGSTYFYQDILKRRRERRYAKDTKSVYKDKSLRPLPTGRKPLQEIEPSYYKEVNDAISKWEEKRKKEGRLLYA